MGAYWRRSAAGGGGGGSGGGGGLEIKDHWSGDLNWSTANQWLAVGTDAVPDDATWLLWNGGAASAGDNDGPAALTTWINAVDWRALTADTAGTTPGDGTGMIFVDWIATDIGDGTPDFARRDLAIGRTSANVALMMTSNTAEDAIGASLKYTTFTEPVAPAAAAAAAADQVTPAERTAGTETAARSFGPFDIADMVRTHRVLELDANDPLPTPTADSAKFVYRPGAQAQFWIKEIERHSLQTGTAGQTHILPGSAGYSDFQGVLNGQPPVASASLGDYYFDTYYSRRHFYEFAFVGPALTGANRWAGVQIDGITGDPFGTPADATSSNAVFVGEATGPHAAILMIDPDTYVATNKYYFVNSTQSRLYLLTGITLPADPFDSYSYRALNTPPSALPTAYWYISGQTERWPGSYPYTVTPSSSRLRVTWANDLPNEALYGWEDIGNIFVAGSVVSVSGTNIDFSAAPSFATDDVVFSPPAGRYDISATLGSSLESLPDLEFAILLYKVQAGDDKIVAATSSRESDLPANFGGVSGSVFRIEAPDVEVSDGDWFYFLIFWGGDATNWRGFLRIEKKL